LPRPSVVAPLATQVESCAELDVVTLMTRCTACWLSRARSPNHCAQVGYFHEPSPFVIHGTATY
jgi:hypothetical protein